MAAATDSATQPHAVTDSGSAANGMKASTVGGRPEKWNDCPDPTSTAVHGLPPSRKARAPRA